MKKNNLVFLLHFNRLRFGSPSGSSLNAFTWTKGTSYLIFLFFSLYTLVSVQHCMVMQYFYPLHTIDVRNQQNVRNCRLSSDKFNSDVDRQTRTTHTFYVPRHILSSLMQGVLCSLCLIFSHNGWFYLHAFLRARKVLIALKLILHNVL